MIPFWGTIFFITNLLICSFGSLIKLKYEIVLDKGTGAEVRSDVGVVPVIDELICIGGGGPFSGGLREAGNLSFDGANAATHCILGFALFERNEARQYEESLTGVIYGGI